MVDEAIDLSSQSIMSSHALAHARMARWPPTPPDPSDPAPTASNEVSSVMTALDVMSTERAALEHLEHLYQSNARAQVAFARAVDQIARSVHAGGKLVVCGVGKSGKIGRKIEATMNSLGVYSAFLHPTEALHGDLGLVRPNDTMLLISFSGRSPELLSLVPHIPPTVPVIALTSHTQHAECPLLDLHAQGGMGILLPAPIHESEEKSLGVGAPTSSTTVALCLGDALAVAVARRLHKGPGRSPADVFRSFHPGGAIGAGAAGKMLLNTFSTTAFDSPSSSTSSMWEELADAPSIPPFTLQPPPDERPIPMDMLVPFNDIAKCPYDHSIGPGSTTLMQILVWSYKYPKSKSWLLLGSTAIVSPRGLKLILDLGCNDYNLTIEEVMTKNRNELAEKWPAMIPREKWFQVLHTTPLAEVQRIAASRQTGPDPITVIAVVRILGNLATCVGMVDAHDILSAR